MSKRSNILRVLHEDLGKKSCKKIAVPKLSDENIAKIKVMLYLDINKEIKQMLMFTDEKYFDLNWYYNV